jgi:hypothetical protein
VQWIRKLVGAFEEDAVHQPGLSARRHEQVDRPVEPRGGHVVQCQRVHPGQHGLRARDRECRVDALRSARRFVREQHQTRLQPLPRPARLAPFVDRAAGEAQRDQLGGRGHEVVEDAGDGVQVEECAVLVHVGKQTRPRPPPPLVKIIMWTTPPAVDNSAPSNLDDPIRVRDRG